MALVLHLSDLHLGHPIVMGDPKNTVLDGVHMDSHIDVLGASLEALSAELGEADLDCIVITGDVTDKGQPSGFDLLPKILARLGSKYPGDERVIVVPGNHDVVAGSPVSSIERYKHFIKLRSFGYLTPPLEGVDSPGIYRPDEAVLVARDESFVIVGTNTADHSMVRNPVETDLEPHMFRIEAEASAEGLLANKGPWFQLHKAWMNRGMHDLARLSRHQRDWLSASFAGPLIPSSALRIVAFHHQLVPVTKMEEGKSFETMTNAGVVHSVLASSNVRLVLHGHKHAAQTRATTAARIDSDSGEEHRMVMVSAPAIESMSNRAQAIGNLIEVQPHSNPEVWPVWITELPAVVPGEVYERSMRDFRKREVTIDPAHRDGTVTGRDVDGVHDRLLSLAAKRFLDVPLPLVCRVERGDTCQKLPINFPSPVPSASGVDWLSEIVGWWQQPSREGAGDFNHGERLRQYNGHFDQLAAVIKELSGSPSTSRAVMSLHYPDRDVGDAPYPSFVLAHFTVRDGKLDVSGYYRKQEMAHWWPVNVAELAYLQNEVIEGIGGPRLEPGAISTITAQPRSGEGLPDVAVPALDREVRSGLIERLVLSVIVRVDEPDAARRDWSRIFTDWRPEKSRLPEGDDPMPGAGLEALLFQVKAVSDKVAPERGRLGDLVLRLQTLKGFNDGYSRAARDLWVDDVIGTMEAIEEILNDVFRSLYGRSALSRSRFGKKHRVWKGAQKP